jgi:hypothetical protein
VQGPPPSYGRNRDIGKEPAHARFLHGLRRIALRGSPAARIHRHTLA